MTADAEIDVAALNGADLETYVNYPAIQDGDVITVVWRGADAQGEPIDDTLAATSVFNPDPIKGMRVNIKNKLLVDAEGGWAFYSYQINGDVPSESVRLFCYVGLRNRPVVQERLAVVQVLQSHDRVIDFSAISAAATLYIPPYQAMQVGDRVTVLLNGQEQDGTPIGEIAYDCSPRAEDLGQVLVCTARRSDWRDLVDGSAQLHYEVELKDQPGTPLLAPEQSFLVRTMPAGEPLLPELDIVGFDGSDVLDPAFFASGLTVQTRCPAQAMAGDLVLCHWVGTRADNRHILALRLDASSLPGGLMQFHLDVKALDASVGDDVEVFLQIARKGWALSSAPLAFKVERARGKLVAPTVAKTASDGAANRIVGSASDFRDGALVTVPDGMVQAGDTLWVNWLGDPQGGRTTVHAPDDPLQPLTFRVPAEFIAANMEQSDSAAAKRFPVSYTRKTDKGEEESPKVELRIHPVPRDGYLSVVCHEAESNNDLWLGQLTEDPHLVLRAWPYMAQGNPVTIWVTGVLAAGGTYEKTLRDAVPVAANELAEQMVVARWPLQEVKGLALDSSATLHARISFDGGQSTFPVPEAFIRIRP
ncbi:hypothetical protein KSS94_07615 [Pseudomonas fakonensis]|uniref:Uncharacterized protein n=1 Tax=Pseudomonas fakonensis TaxID=2842355 RepID=A0ABX8NC30_9PSED|nr:hypothetical protein [Pseudomonas fakonensis]QXH52983.1 hypothetical protein KSS94_07615 [Pseudomonas fakonensis]